MNTSTQDLAVTIGLIAGISKAFRFEATYPSAKVSTEADPYAVPEFTCQLLEMVDTTFAPARESYDFYFTDRETRDAIFASSNRIRRIYHGKSAS